MLRDANKGKTKETFEVKNNIKLKKKTMENKMGNTQ